MCKNLCYGEFDTFQIIWFESNKYMILLLWFTLHQQFLWSMTNIKFYKLVCLVHLHTIPQTMNIYPNDMNDKLVVVYYNIGKPNLFRIHDDVTLFGLKDQLN